VNDTKYYKYFVLVYQKLGTGYGGTSNGDTVNIGEWELYGYEEGDTSVDVVHRSIPNKPGQQHLEVYWDAADSNSYSFADSSNVYDLSGSAVKGTITGTNGFDAEYNAWVFDGSGDYISGTLPSSASGDWVHSMSMWFKADSFSTAYDSNTLFYGGGSSVTANNMTFLRVRGGDDPFIAYNDLGRVAQKFMTITTGVWYHVTATYSGGGWSNAKLYINGSLAAEGEADTTPLTFTASSSFYVAKAINASNPSFNGSIANFRLFSKVLNADQVRELYEYDAPRFGHRQNLVSLHKGNLGVGVPNPTSRFEVAGADGLQEYPPKAMTGHETYIEGHGVFRVSGSSFVDASVSGGIWTQDFPTWYAFNKSNTQGWITDVSKYTDGIADSDSDNRFGIRGEWLEIEMPSKIKLKHFTLSLAYDGGDSSDDPLITSRFPKVFNLYKSNDGITWTSATEITTPTAPVLASYGSTQQYDIDENEYYNRYLIQVKQTFADGTYTGSRSTHTAMGEWRLFGTPAPSALEDGHLTLGKALTLPRVSGHPAGAETPRAESSWSTTIPRWIRWSRGVRWWTFRVRGIMGPSMGLYMIRRSGR
jgi:hypothetical protein